MDINHLEDPIWYDAAIAVNLMYPFLVAVFSRWLQDARVAVTVPIAASTVAAAYGALTLLTAVERFEAGWPTRAAGISTALVPISIGAAVSAVLSGVVASAATKSFAARRTRSGTILIALEAIGCIAWAALAWSLLRSTLPSLNALKAAAWSTFIFSATILTMSVALTVLAKPLSNAVAAPKRWFAVFAAVSAIAAILFFWGSVKLERDLNGGSDDKSGPSASTCQMTERALQVAVYE